MSRRLRISKGVAVWALPMLVLGIQASPLRAEIDDRPPTILVPRAQPVAVDEALVVSAEVRGPRGLERVVVWARSEGEEEFRAFDMIEVAESRFEAELPPWPGRGAQVQYYIEASDAADPIPARSGNPRQPYLVHLGSKVEAESDPSGGLDLQQGVLIGLGAILLVALVLHVQARREGHRAANKAGEEFWGSRLQPLRGLRGAELETEIEEFCASTHYPHHGHPVRVTRGEVLRMLKRLPGLALGVPTRRARSERERSPQPARSMPAAAWDQPDVASVDSIEKIEEELFWYRLMTPLLDKEQREVRQDLRQLASRPLSPPGSAKRYFDLNTLRRQFAWVQTVDVRDLRERWRRVREAAHLETAAAADQDKVEEIEAALLAAFGEEPVGASET